MPESTIAYREEIFNATLFIYLSKILPGNLAQTLNKGQRTLLNREAFILQIMILVSRYSCSFVNKALSVTSCYLALMSPGRQTLWL